MQRNYPMAGRKDGDGADVSHDYRLRTGSYLRSLRLAAGVTQLELADALDVRDASISAVETGRNSIAPDWYETICEVLEVDRVEFGKTILELSNPWVFALLFGNKTPSGRAIKTMPRRTKRGPYANK